MNCYAYKDSRSCNLDAKALRVTLLLLKVMKHKDHLMEQDLYIHFLIRKPNAVFLKIE